MPDSYADLSRFYDLVMTSGYYDYDAYAHALLTRIGTRADVLELGMGTGLVADRLLALGPDDLRLTGIDHTDSMLAQARHRLGGRARFRREDVLDMSFPPAFDVAYSVGGVWYIVQDGEESWLSSHLMEEKDNETGLTNLAAAIRPGGSLLLSVQGPTDALTEPCPEVCSTRSTSRSTPKAGTPRTGCGSPAPPLPALPPRNG
ncbi:class I SAM-dependent methyltransferase [Streptomyces virginiae]|uniref:class I SAM-dependent methyltransferase n=1 Tax=Streptomyces virginiae TaxID=1961 RepID=UPI00342985F9